MKSNSSLENTTKLIIGLGNPGTKYLHSRHNIGFWCVDRLAREKSLTFSKNTTTAIFAEGKIEENRIILAKPQTYVNNSGKAVNDLLKIYSVSTSSLILVYDDMELPVGSLRIRTGGGSGGHNGMKSVIDCVGSSDFARLRIGIGRPPIGSSEIEYVLGTMQNEEYDNVDKVIGEVSKAISCILAQGIEEAMNIFNKSISTDCISQP